MENDVLKNKIAPWQEKGRWVHGIYDYADSAFIASETDELLMNSGVVSTVGAVIVFSVVDHPVLDVKVQTKDVTITLELPVPFMNRRYYTSGKYVTVIGPTSDTGTLEIWAFIK